MPDASCWLVDPGVDIPQEAAEVHGISTEYARTHGIEPVQALTDIRARIVAAKEAGEILVGHNIVFDLTILDRESRRHLPDEAPVAELLGVALDTRVIDKHLDTYRRGKRTLEATAAHYGVTIDSPHDAVFDAKAAVQIAEQIVTRYPAFADGIPATFLMEFQQAAKNTQAASLQSYLRRVKDPSAVVDPSWPLTPYREQ